MNSGIKLQSFRKPALLAVLFLMTASAITALAQNANSAKSVTMIDGATEPDRIPDWILWRELFNGALMLSEKAPDAGRSFWVGSLGLTQGQMNQLIAHGRALRAGT